MTPYHPIFVHFTVALSAMAFVAELGGVLLDERSLGAAAWWMIAAAAALTSGTVATGVATRLRVPMEEGKARSVLRTHAAIGPLLFGVLIAIAFWRADLWADSARVPATYLVALGSLVLLVVVQGFLGGELVFRYGVSVRGRYRPLPTEHPESPPGAHL